MRGAGPGRYSDRLSAGMPAGALESCPGTLMDSLGDPLQALGVGFREMSVAYFPDLGQSLPYLPLEDDYCLCGRIL